MDERFQSGDKVKANGREGVIVSINYDADRLVYKIAERGGSENFVNGHISSTQLELLESPATPAEAVEDEPVVLVEQPEVTETETEQQESE